MKKQNKRKKIFERGTSVGDPRYTDAMKISIPYCKERLLHNEIPELAMTFNMGGSDVEFTTHPSDHCISILYSTDDADIARLKFLYYLIAGVVDVDYRLTFDTSYPIYELETDKVDMDQFVSQLFRFKRHAPHPSHGGSTLSRFFVLHRNYRKTL